MAIATPPPELIRVRSDEAVAIVTLETTDDVPGGTIGYTVETFSHGTQETSRPERLHRAHGVSSFEIQIPVGAADPSDPDASIVEVQVVTSVGSFRLRLQPDPPDDGVYAGTVTVPRFGQVGLPMDFEVVTDPPGVPIEDANAAYLVLPVAPGNIFSPVAPTAEGMPAAVAVPLELQDFDQRWIARARAPFDFPDTSLLGSYPAGQVVRGLRFELELDQGALTGTLRDTWEGLYDRTTIAGNTSAATVIFEGRLDLTRRGSSRGIDALPDVLELTSDSPTVQPPLDARGVCSSDHFDVPSLAVDDVTADCEGITSVSEFEQAEASDQLSCAVAVVESALLADNTTANLIAAFLSGDTEVTGDESFAEFMARCAAGTDGACRPSEEVLCGRSLAAYAISQEADPDPNLATLVDAYTRATREAFLGRQLGAYQSDADTRLEWLKAQGYPAVVTAAVRELNERLIEDWKDLVLDTHFDALAGMYDGAGLAVLAREMMGDVLIDQRQLLLLEMSQSWRGAMEALTISTRRSNDVYQDATSRGEEAAFASSRAFDLYVLGGIVDQLNDAAGSEFGSAGLATGFSALLRELRRLALPFSALVFERDAEVVVSRSLNPLSTDDTLLGEIQVAAHEEIELAAELVQGVLDRAQERAVDEQLLRDDLNNQIDAQFDELIELCGMPEGCGRADRERPECWPRVVAGECGFGTEVTNMGTADVPQLTVTVVDYTASSNVSDAGAVILEVLAASDALDDSQLAFAKYKQITDLMTDTNEAYAATIEDWKARDAEIQDDIDDLLDQLDGVRDARVQDYVTLVESTKAERSAAVERRTMDIQNINQIRSDNVTYDITEIRSATALSQTANTLRSASNEIHQLAAISSDGLPKGMDDILAPARMAFKLTAYGVTSGLAVAAEGADVAARLLEDGREIRNLLAANQIASDEAYGDLDLIRRENNIANAEAELSLNVEVSQAQEAAIQESIARLEEQLAADVQLDRDFDNLRQRRDAVAERLVGELDRSLDIRQAEFTVQQRQTDYLRLVQRAQLLDGRLRNLVEQRDLVNLNLGSPSVVFGWANQLEQAENRLERAKDKVMDWVVALEYLAVRPFFDARLQILLARNTYQLEEIATSLDDIQARCGGAINTNSRVLSLRDDVLRVDAATVDAASGDVLTPPEAFREILARGGIPVDKRVRFSSDATIGDLVSREGIWATSFDLGLSAFANLGASCNAKVESIAIQLVGRELGRAAPTVSIAYDGTSTVRSCQADIEDIVDGIGRDATAFGAVTRFNTPGRVVSPVAGVNEFGGDNQTLVGLPLASQYSVIIDPTLGENARINWTNLEDILVRIDYAYQDFYPEGQCY